MAERRTESQLWICRLAGVGEHGNKKYLFVGKRGPMAEEKIITSVMGEKRIFYPPEELSRKAYIKSVDEYRQIYQRSISDPERFWGEMAEQIDWYKKWVLSI